MSSIERRRFSDSQVHRDRVKLPPAPPTAENSTRGAFETIGRQLELEEKLHVFSQQLLQSYKETQQWACVGQIAQGLVASSQRVGQLKRQLESLRENSRALFLESISERSSLPPPDPEDLEEARDQANADQSSAVIDTPVTARLEEAPEIPAEPDIPVDSSEHGSEPPPSIERRSHLVEEPLSSVVDLQFSEFPATSDSDQNEEKAGVKTTVAQTTNVESTAAVGVSESTTTEGSVEREESEGQLVREIEQSLYKEEEEDNSLAGPTESLEDNSHPQCAEETVADAPLDVITTTGDSKETETVCKQEGEQVEFNDEDNVHASCAIPPAETSSSAPLLPSDQPTAIVELKNCTQLESEPVLVADPSSRVDSPPPLTLSLAAATTDQSQQSTGHQQAVNKGEAFLPVVSPEATQINAADELGPTTSVSSIDKEFGIVDDCLDELTSEIEALISVSELSSETSEQFFSPPESIVAEAEYDYTEQESLEKEEAEKPVILADPVVASQQREEEEEKRVESEIEREIASESPLQQLEEGEGGSVQDFEPDREDSPAAVADSDEVDLPDLPEETNLDLPTQQLEEGEGGSVQDFERDREDSPAAVADSEEVVPDLPEETNLDLPTGDPDSTEEAAAETDNQVRVQVEDKMEPPKAAQPSLKVSVRTASPSSLPDENNLGTVCYVIDALGDQNGKTQLPILSEPVVHRLDDFVELHQQLASLEERSIDEEGALDVPELDLNTCPFNGFDEGNGPPAESERAETEQSHDDKSEVLELFLNQIASDPRLQNEPVVINFLTPPTQSVSNEMPAPTSGLSTTPADETADSLTAHVNGMEEQEPASEGDEMIQSGRAVSGDVCSTEQESIQKEEISERSLSPTNQLAETAAPHLNEEGVAEEEGQEEMESTHNELDERATNKEDQADESDCCEDQCKQDQLSHNDQSNQLNQQDDSNVDSTQQDKDKPSSISVSEEVASIKDVSSTREVMATSEPDNTCLEMSSADFKEGETKTAADVDSKQESSTDEERKQGEVQNTMEAMTMTDKEDDQVSEPREASPPPEQEATSHHHEVETSQVSPQEAELPLSGGEVSPLETSLPKEKDTSKEGAASTVSSPESQPSSPAHKGEVTHVCDDDRGSSLSPAHEKQESSSSLGQDEDKPDIASPSVNGEESDFSPTHSERTSSNATTSSYLYTTDESLSPVKSVGQMPHPNQRRSSDPSILTEDNETEISEQHDAFHMSLMPGQMSQGGSGGGGDSDVRKRKMKRKGSMPLKIKSSINTVKRSFTTKKRGNTIDVSSEAAPSVSMLKPLTTQEWDPTCLLEELYSDYKQGAVSNVNPSGESARHYGYLDKLPTNRTKANVMTKWRRRYFRAQEGNVYYYQDRTADKALGFIHLTSARVVPIPEKNQIQIIPKDGKSIMLKAPNIEEFQTWHRALLLEAAHPTPVAPSSPKPAVENPIVIIDIGACSVRAGLVREDPYPEIFFPAVCSFEDGNFELIECGHNALLPDNRRGAHQVYPRRVSLRMDRHRADVNLPLRAMEGIVSTIMMQLDVEPQLAQLIMTLPPTTPEKERDELIEMLLETFGFAGICLQDQSQLALFSYNSTTGIIVDIGNHITVVPYIDGYAIEAGLTRLPFGGNSITEALAKLVTQKGLRYFSETEMLINRFIKESLCYVSQDFEEDAAKSEENPKDYLRVVEVDRFQLPDHRKMVTLDSALFKAPEGLFSPHLWGKDVPGLHEIVWKAIQACPIDQRRELSKKVYLSGASSLIPGLKERLQKELTSLSPTGVAVEVHANDTCHHAAYCGASVLASLGSFQNYLVSLDDWTVAGAEALRKWTGS